MPEANRCFTVEAPPEETWEYMTDMENFASHLPGFVEYETVDDTTSLWTVKIDLSMYTKQITFEVDVEEESFPVIDFSLDPLEQPAEGGGEVNFEQVAPAETEVSLSVSSTATGRMAPFLNKVIDRAFDSVIDDFVANLEDAPIQQ